MRILAAGAALALLLSPLAAEDNSAPEAVYKPPAGEAPPVAPPLRKGSPLDHLANDPKSDEPKVGYREGHADGAAPWIGHRLIDPEGGQGWGWVVQAGKKWSSGKWVALQESPGLAVAPHRKLAKAEQDLNWEYKLWGKFATYKAYDPRLDEQIPVFLLSGYEVIGEAAPLSNKPGPPDRIQHRPSGASSRPGRPILTDPGVD